MTDWTPVITLKELSRRKKNLVTVDGVGVALFLVGERVFALKDICIHKERQLSKGTVLHGRVICPGHQWAFDLETGYVEDQERCAETYGVKIEDGVVSLWPEPRLRVPDPITAGVQLETA